MYSDQYKRVGGCGVRALMSERDELVCVFTLSLSHSEWAEERLLRRQFAGFCQEKRSKSKKAKTNRANRATKLDSLIPSICKIIIIMTQSLLKKVGEILHFL